MRSLCRSTPARRHPSAHRRARNHRGGALDPQQKLGFFRQEQSDQSFDVQHFLICFHKLVVTSLITKLKNESLRLPPHFGRRRAQKAYGTTLG
jgi:hypothetical protein